MGFSLKKTWGKVKRGVKRKINKVIDPIHDRSRKFYRKSGLKNVMKLAPMLGSAAGGIASMYTGDPRFAAMGGQIGTAAKEALSGNFKKALEVVEDHIPKDVKDNVNKLKSQVEEVADTVTSAVDKADNVLGDIQKAGKDIKHQNFGSALQTVEKYMSPEQKKVMDTAILSGKELKADAQDMLNNLDDVADKGQAFISKFNEKKIQLSDALTGDSMLVDGFQGLKTKATNLVKEGKDKINERIEGVKETMNELKSANLLPADAPADDNTSLGNPSSMNSNPENTAQVQSLKELNELVNTDKMESQILEENADKGSSFSRLLRGED